MCCLWNTRSDVVPCVYGLWTDLMDSCRAAIIPQHVQNKQKRKLNLLVWIRVSAEESYFTLITDIMWETFTTREMQDFMGTNTFSEQLLSAQTTCLWARFSTSSRVQQQHTFPTFIILWAVSQRPPVRRASCVAVVVLLCFCSCVVVLL